jgi:GTP-binding protein Era
MIRASLFQNLKKELPYCCEVQVTEFKEPSSDSTKQVIRMKATVFVERDSQKVIVIGKGGEVIKKVGMDARKSLEDFFQKQVGSL